MLGCYLNSNLVMDPTTIIVIDCKTEQIKKLKQLVSVLKGFLSETFSVDSERRGQQHIFGVWRRYKDLQ